MKVDQALCQIIESITSTIKGHSDISPECLRLNVIDGTRFIQAGVEGKPCPEDASMFQRGLFKEGSLLRQKEYDPAICGKCGYEIEQIKKLKLPYGYVPLFEAICPRCSNKNTVIFRDCYGPHPK